MIALVTGGASSGKSAYAEQLALSLPGEPHLYLATMRCLDAEDQARVTRHQAARQGKGFVTVERPADLADWVCPQGSVVLLECLTALVTNECYGPDGVNQAGGQAILSGIQQIAERADSLIVVSGDLFCDGGDYSQSTLDYLALLGWLHEEIAGMAERVVKVICGIPWELKGELK